MTDPTHAYDHRPGRVASQLRTSRANVRALLALDVDTRREVLYHVARVDAHALLTYMRLMPDVQPV